MYSAFLLTHSWLRWVVLIAGLLVFLRGSRSVNSTTRLFTISLDIQLLVGLVLYGILSPFTQIAFHDMGAAMRDAGLRFWAVEHLIGMLLAVVVAHVGRVQIRRAADEAAKHQKAMIFVGIALGLILVSIPWPWMASGRPFFRF